MGTLTSEPLYHPELKRCNLKLVGALLILKPELVYHPEFRGWPLTEKSELLYHPELTQRMEPWTDGGARIHKIRPPITLNPEGCADLKPELSYITLNSEHRLRAWE